MFIADSNGVVRELVFPKALDLDRPKRARTTFSRDQLDKLESEFTANQYLVGRERSQLARNLGLSETQVKVWFQNRRTKHKRDQEKQAEHQEATAESMATQNLLHILHPPREAHSPAIAHPESPSANSQQKSEDFGLPAGGIPCTPTGLSLPFRIPTQHQQDQFAHRLVDALRPPLNSVADFDIVAASYGRSAAFTGYQAPPVSSPNIHAVSSPTAVPSILHAPNTTSRLHSVSALTSGCPQGVGAVFPADLAARSLRPMGYPGGFSASDTWLGHHDPYLACHPHLGSSLHVRFPPAWPLYTHVPQSLP
ncbi:hypothetical protein V1264_013412 [Littorina saxatilis]|uniref:Homeobox domain-containing protein n=1 Tax=Littorina saxatilis TaxID=31220 RepID=A0AAN9BPK5_9CAEN